MFAKIKKFARLVFDALIVFVCLIGAVEIRSLAATDSEQKLEEVNRKWSNHYACFSDDEDEYDQYMQTFSEMQEARVYELENEYRSVEPHEPLETPRNLFESIYQPFRAIHEFGQWVRNSNIDFEISFLKALKKIPNQFTSESYFLLTVACYYTAAASLVYGTCYKDPHFTELGTFMLIGNMVLWAVPRAAFYCRDQFAWVKRHYT